jgi:membrane protein DedA with SNARE-associated domain
MDTTIAVLVRYGYLVVFGSVLAEQIGAPIPAIPFLLAAGAAAGTGQLSFALLLLLSGIASLIADMTWYVIGRLGGAKVLGWLCRISLEPDSCVRRTGAIFSKHGPRSGVVRMPLGRFVLFSALGGLFWAGAVIALGWIFARQLEIVADYAVRLGSWTLVLIGAALGSYITWKFISRQRFLRRIRIARISPEELKAKLDGGEQLMIVDVRDRIDFEAEPTIIPGALHLMIEDLDQHHQEIPREREIVLYCT